MTDYVGTDFPRGQEVTWYYASTTAGNESKTADATDASNGYIALAANAEWGSVVVSKNGVATSATECSDAAGAVTAAEGTAVASVKFAITSGDELEVRYVAITAALVEVGGCQDVTFATSADKTSESIHGQANKVSIIGAAENTGTLRKFFYGTTFLGVAFGDTISTDPTTSKETWTNAFHGPKKIGALIGKRKNSSGTVLEKYFLVGVQFDGLDFTFDPSSWYKESLSFTCDWAAKTDLS